jgi:phage tail-like protein
MPQPRRQHALLFGQSELALISKIKSWVTQRGVTMPDYPIPVFHFQVEWGGTRLGFSEVSGLTIEVEAIEYREGSSPDYSTVKMPGVKTYGNITLKRGIIPNDNGFYEWLNTIRLNQVERRDLVISLLDENHEPVMVWKAVNAFPVKIAGPVLKATGNEVAIESLEVAHEGLIIENG